MFLACSFSEMIHREPPAAAVGWPWVAGDLWQDPLRQSRNVGQTGKASGRGKARSFAALCGFLFVIALSISFIYYLHQRGDSRKRLNHLGKQKG
jgi:hypothetical protein